MRKITAADFEWAFELHKAAMGEYVARTWGWEEDFQRQLFADRFQGKPRQVIQVAGQDVGVVELEERSDELYLGLLELLPAWQGQGLGSDILRALLRRAADAGKPLSLHVLKTNPRAAALYHRHGLRVVASEEAKLLMRTSPSG
ncbi:MAG: GNAT family N-acetyltransferase, partial [Gammaproteobacteria bacterium]